MLTPFMSKEVLYEPLKELYQHYPNWLETNKNILSKDEYKKREQQCSVVKQIIDEFDKNEHCSQERIVDLVQQMGHPPPDLAEFLSQ